MAERNDYKRIPSLSRSIRISGGIIDFGLAAPSTRTWMFVSYHRPEALSEGLTISPISAISASSITVVPHVPRTEHAVQQPERYPVGTVFAIGFTLVE